jgi:ATP-binding cassette, subfamily B, vacuolar membrane transporter HMT1/ACLQ
MWSKQAKAQKAAEDAMNATQKAEKLMRKASLNHGNDDDASSSSDESTMNGKPRPCDS